MLTRLNAIAAGVGFGVLISASAALADPPPCQVRVDDINALQQLNNDFFDAGREQFEDEIERLLDRKAQPQKPLLTIAPSVQFEPEQYEGDVTPWPLFDLEMEAQPLD